MTDFNPKLSIITVSYNSAKTIEKTILSVINQTYKNIEYIIIDGSSTDGTVDIIKKYQDRISYWVSEKDGGIYDAMNKGTSIAHGEYLNFMNSDDYFFSNSALEESVEFLNGEYDIVYGNMELRDDSFKQIRNIPSPKYLWMGHMSHQSSFIKRSTMLKYKYNTSNRIVADYEFFLNVYYNDGKLLKIDKTISSFYSNGFSGQNIKQSIEDWYKTVRQFNHNPIIPIYYFYRKIKIILIFLLKKIIKPKLYYRIKKYTWDVFN